MYFTHCVSLAWGGSLTWRFTWRRGCLVADPLINVSLTWRFLFKRGSHSEEDIIAHLEMEMPSTMDLDEGMRFGLQVYLTNFN